MRFTSRAPSRIWDEWITGFGTETRSLRPPPSGELIETVATINPPAVLRMSWRSVTVLSTGPVFIEPWLRPM